MPTLPHLVVAPVVLPLVAAMLMLLLGSRRRVLASVINAAAALLGLGVAAAILWQVDAGGDRGATAVYLASNWEAPFGIVLVADRLSALLLVLTGTVAFSAALYAMSAWGRAGVYFHPLFQLLLMGLNGAFLTGDLFNLFVFFEVALAASYGLHLHGSGTARVKSGLHYIAVNLVASSLFLIGIAVVYGITGTLTMADIAATVPQVADADRGLLHAGAALLATAFLIKAAMWPVNFWLVPTYQAASAPVAALFALMTRLGVYTLLRLWTLCFSAEAGASARLGADLFVVGGLATLLFGTIGMIADRPLARVAGFSILVSSGTLLAALGLGSEAALSAALYYLLSATVAASALFLLVEQIERMASGGSARLAELDPEPDEDTNLDDAEMPLVGRRLPIPLALLGLGFMICAVLVAGLPPLSGFVAKLALLSAVMRPIVDGGPTTAPAAGWLLFAALLLSGLVALVVMAKAGIRHFWTSSAPPLPPVKFVEALPILLLMLAGVGLTLRAEDVLRYAGATARELATPAAYVEAVFSADPRPGPTRPAGRAEAAP